MPTSLLISFVLVISVGMTPSARAQNGGNNAAPLRPVSDPRELRPVRDAQLPYSPPSGQGVQQIPSGQQLSIDNLAKPKDQDGEDDQGGGNSSNPAAALIPAVLSGLGGGGGGPTSNTRAPVQNSSNGSGAGGDRAAGSDASGASASPASSGIDNSLQMGKTTVVGNQEYTTINGCSKVNGKFSVVYGNPPANCNPKNDSALKINKELADFMDQNLNRCAAKAANKNSVVVGQIWHAGVMGDADHQKTGSLHNLGLAIDLNAIKVDNVVYKYSDAGSDPAKSFFKQFRQCWGEAAQTTRGGCLKRRLQAPGTVGNENTDHQNHLHLSLPYCPDKAKQLGLYIALAPLWLAAGPGAHAAEEPPAAERTRRVIAIPFGRAELTQLDQHGEPLDADQRFTVVVQCANEPARRKLVEDLGGCGFASFEFVTSSNQIELRYRTSVMRDGRLSCAKIETKRFTPGCVAR